MNPYNNKLLVLRIVVKQNLHVAERIQRAVSVPIQTATVLVSRCLHWPAATPCHRRLYHRTGEDRRTGDSHLPIAMGILITYNQLPNPLFPYCTVKPRRGNNQLVFKQVFLYVSTLILPFSFSDFALKYRQQRDWKTCGEDWCQWSEFLRSCVHSMQCTDLQKPNELL